MKGRGAIRRLRPIDMPVMAAKCTSCPFREGGDPDLRARVSSLVLTEASQVCHHPAIAGKPQTHLCRGARDLQIEMFHRLGVIDSPTDEAWAQAAKRAGL